MKEKLSPAAQTFYDEHRKRMEAEFHFNMENGKSKDINGEIKQICYVVRKHTVKPTNTITWSVLHDKDATLNMKWEGTMDQSIITELSQKGYIECIPTYTESYDEFKFIVKDT